MMKKDYPSTFEINEVCNNFIKRKELNRFLQERGLFIFNAGADEVGKILSHLVLQRSEFEQLRGYAYQASTKSSLSGFIINSTTKSLNLNDLYEKARDDDRLLLSKGFKLGTLSYEQRNGKNIFKGSVDYEIRKPGRIQFIETEEGHSNFIFFENEEGEWQVEVDGTRSNDGREIQKLFSSLIDKEVMQVRCLKIEALTDSQTIDFFDALADHGMSSDWRFEDVKSLTFKRGKGHDADNEEIEINTEENKNDDSALTGIRQAILDGKNLREDAFVKQFESAGCIFTAMTFEFHHKTEPEVIHIRAEFKGNPKIFEVSIVNTYEIKGPEAKPEISVISKNKNFELRSLFWNNAKKIFFEVKKDKTSI